jgi:spore maturation protein CgeB
VKILYINSRYSDYQQDLIYSGLVEVIGRENVMDYPWNPKFHLPYKSYPRNLGYSNFSLPKPLFSISQFDLVILASAKKDSLAAYDKLLPQIINKPILFLDGGDWPEVGGDFHRLKLSAAYKEVVKKRSFDIVLKREFIPSLHESDKRIFPFPFSFPYDVQTKGRDGKKYDVSFWAQPTPDIRTRALKLLSERYDCKQNGTWLSQDFSTFKRKGKFYLEEIARCKIVLNFRGTGWDTMRYWETPAMGTFMISQKPRIQIPNNFEEGKHIVWCSDDLSDLIDKIDYYLKHSSERETMAARAREHVRKYHLNNRRARFLMKIVWDIL